MADVFYVGIGGFLGTVVRYLTYICVSRYFAFAFPLATLVVNIVGCFALGMISAFAERQSISPQILPMISVGVIGGFTTFSAFGMETVSLWKNAYAPLALINIGANLILGLGAVMLGHSLAK